MWTVCLAAASFLPSASSTHSSIAYGIVEIQVHNDLTLFPNELVLVSLVKMPAGPVLAAEIGARVFYARRLQLKTKEWVTQLAAITGGIQFLELEPATGSSARGVHQWRGRRMEYDYRE